MKAEPKSDRGEAIGKALLVFIGFVTVAFIVWEVQDFAASFAAHGMTTHTTLRTLNERDDARVRQAFAQARRSLRVDATLETEPNPRQETRDSRLTVNGKSKSDTLSNRAAMVSEMQGAFKQAGGEELRDIGNAPYAQPVEDHSYLLVKQCFRWGAIGILILGLTNITLRWRSLELPPSGLVGILAAALILVLSGLGHGGNSVRLLLALVAPPAALLGLAFVLTRRVYRARRWKEARARIVASKITVEHHRFSGDTTKVRNLPRVEYEFDPGDGPLRGDRITLGFATAENAHAVLQRYPVGSFAPVYYNPRNPQECVLERNPPVSFGCLWAGVIFLVIGYLLVALNVSDIISLSDSLKGVFPQLHHPVIVIIAGLLGLLALITGGWNLLHPPRNSSWIKTQGTIVSSTTESFRDTSSSTPHATLYRPVIEFSYKVEGQTYHGPTGSSGVTLASSSKKWADAKVTRYPAGLQVDVFYDPNDPTQSSLSPKTMPGYRASLVIGTVLLAIAGYTARH